MKNTIYRYVLYAIVAALLLAGFSVSNVAQENPEQISLCILDYVEVLD